MESEVQAGNRQAAGHTQPGLCRTRRFTAENLLADLLARRLPLRQRLDDGSLRTVAAGLLIQVASDDPGESPDSAGPRHPSLKPCGRRLAGSRQLAAIDELE